ncbi:MAG TPA: amidohydrolase [Phenylobacterium sp.]|jgi:predicted amidohydrolase YtcJ|uniref:amidohydrolase n=1 Tax=Phenylobacterium sp. TaxID=1871053 RepID=UPI002C5A1351|nr:amidohydrolase [Phenylobacterium sp.]HXA38702.1 amidohydrolase [Phenylobacterium sp.]
MRAWDQNRRGFLGLAGAGLGASWAGASLAGPDDPDLVVFNAKVLTVEAAAPRAQAFAVRGGRFVAVGRNEDIRSLVGPRTQTFDAQGMTIAPGFIDCHNHAPGETLLYDVLVGNPFEVEFVTIDSIVGKLRAKAQTLPPDTWVVGEFYDDTKVKDGRLIDVRDLDKVSTTQPVVVRHRGGHTSFYNSRALAMAGITKATQNPPGGTFDRFPDGELNGRVTDRANVAVEAVGRRQAFTPEEHARRARDGLAHISKQFVRYGLTSVHHEGGDLGALQDVRARGELKHRVSYEAQPLVLEAMIRSGLQTGFGDEWIKLGATSEHIVDGSFSERTMAMSHAYPGVSPPYFGNLTETQDVLNGWIERVHRAGIDINCHANGDVAIAQVLTAVERAQKLYPRSNARPKITHCTLLNDELIARIKAAGVVPAVFSTYAYYNPDKFPFYGAETMTHAMAFRSLLDAGVPVCAGSDFNPGPFSPLMAIQAMVTRKGWDGKVWGANQRITVDEALRVNTLNGAYASHEEAIKGSIAPGKLADFVVLAEDPHTADPDKIKDIAIVRTVTGGTTVYQA